MANLGLSDWQHHVNSLTLGPATKYRYTVDGLYDLTTAANDLEKTGNGVYAARDRSSGRPITFTYEIVDTPGSTFATTFTTFLACWRVPASADETLQWKVPGIANERYVTGRRRRRAMGKLDEIFEAGKAVVICEFYCTDPQVYDAVTAAAVDY